jgi:hypothetical protein
MKLDHFTSARHLYGIHSKVKQWTCLSTQPTVNQIRKTIGEVTKLRAVSARAPINISVLVFVIE